MEPRRGDFMKEEEERLENEVKRLENNLKTCAASERSFYRRKLGKTGEALCDFYLDRNRFENGLIACNRVLLNVTTENLMVINYICCENLKMTEKAKEVVVKGLEMYPDNKLFKQHKPKEEVQTGPVMPGLSTPPPGMKIDKDKLKMIENMDDSQIGMMAEMMKGVNNKAQFEQMSGRTLSDQEYESMKGMMNPDMIKMAMNMMKSNPDLLNNMPNNMHNNRNPPMFNNASFPPPSTMNTSFKKKDMPQSVNHVENDNTPPMPPNMMPQQPPSMNNMNILENRGMIKTALKMFKDNPKQLLTMIASSTNNQQINRLADVSESKLKFISNILYYLISFCLELFYYLSKYKSMIVIFLIAFFVYKMI